MEDAKTQRIQLARKRIRENAEFSEAFTAEKRSEKQQAKVDEFKRINRGVDASLAVLAKDYVGKEIDLEILTVCDNDESSQRVKKEALDKIFAKESETKEASK